MPAPRGTQDVALEPKCRRSTRDPLVRREHQLCDLDGITNEIVEARRPSAYFIPVAPPKKKGKQLWC